MCFSTLPDEVLLLIISETTLITYLKEPLVSLARVNRCLRHLVTPVLYDNVSVSLHNKDFDLFKRNVTADSYLASLVRTLTLGTPPSSWWEEHQGSTESHRCALVLLQSLPELLSLDLMDRIHIPYPSSPQLNHVLLPSLRRVDLPRETTTNDIARFVLLPNVERVVVATHDSGDHDMIPSLPPGIKFGSSPLKYLKFGGTSMPDAAMHKLLSLPRSLEELSCDFDETALPVMFSPICILRALAPVRQTLVKLRLTGERISDVDECDKSRMDFSGFTSLRKLKIMSRLLFLWNEQDTLSRRCELYNRLPTGLEYLRVSTKGFKTLSQTDLFARWNSRQEIAFSRTGRNQLSRTTAI